MKKDFVVIFDLDGTVLNTDLLIHQSFEHVFNQYKPGYQLSRQEHLSFLGPKLTDSFLRYFPKEMLDDLVECYREYNHAHHEVVTIYPTVRETLQMLKEKGYPLAILTTKYSGATQIGLNTFDLNQYFDVVLCGDEVEKGKPDPSGIYQIMEQLNVNRAVMIGDNASDILTGKNASVYTIGVKWSPKGTKEVEELNPDLMINQMDEIIEFIERVS